MSSQPEGPEREYEQLKRLLLHQELARIEGLEQRLREPEHHAPLVGRDLPRAIRVSSAEGRKLSHALSPTVEGILHDSVRNDPRTMADALYPVMGPSIRRSIAEALSGMIQSFNEVLGNSFSWQGFKWRLEAMRTRKSFAEVVLLHSLVYRVEQCFLIHQETGLVLQHLSAEAVQHQDADMIAAMLTAIQDFVKDSFSTGDEALESLQVGELRLLLRKGPEAVLALVVRGNPPQELGTAAREALDTIHEEMRPQLRGFDGDAAIFEQIRPVLQDCMLARYQPRKKRRPWALMVVLAVLAALLVGAGGYFERQRQARKDAWNAFVASLEQAPGMLVVEHTQNGEQGSVRGLRDPLAGDPGELLAASAVRGWDVALRFEPYQSMEPEFVLRRAAIDLAPPATVQLALTGGALRAEGEADLDWLGRARSMVRAVAGLTGYDDSGVTSTELRRFDFLASRLEERWISFDEGSSRGADAEALDAATKDILELQGLAARLENSFTLLLTGTSTSTGSADANSRLRELRVEAVREELARRGVARELMQVRTREVFNAALGSKSQNHPRSVFFTVGSLRPTSTPLDWSGGGRTTQ
jgi:OOP family OmpA-OmpF porin